MNVLFITSTRLGDAILSTGLLGYLVDTLPEARFTIACGGLPAPLFRAMPRLHRVIPMVKRKRAGHWIDLWRSCVGTYWDLAVDLRNSPVSLLLAVRRRAVLPPSAPAVHRSVQIAATMGLSEVPWLRLWFGEADLALAERLVPPGPPVLALAPVANWRGKTWPVDRFIGLAAALTREGGMLAGGRVAVFGGEAERDQARPLLDSLPADRRLDLMGRLDPLQAGACLARCAIFVGNDSGAMHLAAAAGTPTLGLFGPSRDEHYAPWGRHTAVVRTSLSYETLAAAPDAFRSDAGTHMDSLRLDAVIEAAHTLWQRVEADR